MNFEKLFIDSHFIASAPSDLNVSLPLLRHVYFIPMRIWYITETQMQNFDWIFPSLLNEVIVFHIPKENKMSIWFAPGEFYEARKFYCVK